MSISSEMDRMDQKLSRLEECVFGYPNVAPGESIPDQNIRDQIADRCLRRRMNKAEAFIAALEMLKVVDFIERVKCMVVEPNDPDVVTITMMLERRGGQEWVQWCTDFGLRGAIKAFIESLGKGAVIAVFKRLIDSDVWSAATGQKTADDLWQAVREELGEMQIGYDKAEAEARARRADSS